MSFIYIRFKNKNYVYKLQKFSNQQKAEIFDMLSSINDVVNEDLYVFLSNDTYNISITIMMAKHIKQIHSMVSEMYNR